MSTSARPHENIQGSIQAKAVPARSGFLAMSIQDYTRICQERSEFLDFLLTPNPAGIPATRYGLLKAA
ncbi:MAG: nuclease PIN [Rothia sp. (in: high G+C Gram-positive bacteria)]|nr:nuclease PIN [Rothia sp. (in: high G+C Gram-positive bacteria)]